MIQANELRIGNLVCYDGRVFEIDTIAKEFPTLNTTEFGIGVVGWNDIEPIIITEEWLLKFGFIEINRSNFRISFDHIQTRFIGYDFCEKEKEFNGFRYYGHYLHNINHIHQLQNLYFALTQTELTLKDA
jgi:hypothetical protein